jgi:hypothetical protein
MTVFNVHHTTTYRYKKPVTPGRHLMLFRPGDSFDQRLLDSRQLLGFTQSSQARRKTSCDSVTDGSAQTHRTLAGEPPSSTGSLT